MLDIQLDEADSYTVCRPVGELDAYTVGQFRDALGELADKRYLLIDLSSVPFMDSAGLGALIGGIRRAREAGGDVAALPLDGAGYRGPVRRELSAPAGLQLEVFTPPSAPPTTEPTRAAHGPHWQPAQPAPQGPRTIIPSRAMLTTPAIDAVGRRLIGRGHYDRFRSRVRDLPEFGGELLERLGRFHTLGMPEQLHPLSDGWYGYDAFLAECDAVHAERRQMPADLGDWSDAPIVTPEDVWRAMHLLADAA